MARSPRTEAAGPTSDATADRCPFGCPSDPVDDWLRGCGCRPAEVADRFSSTVDHRGVGRPADPKLWHMRSASRRTAGVVRREARTAGAADIGIVIAAFLLAAGLVVAAFIAVRGIEYVKGYESSRLDVTGSADRAVVSDQVKWTGSFSRRVDARSLGSGYRQMSADLDEVLDVLADEGCSREDLSIQPVSVSAVYRACYNAGAECVR